MSVTESERHQLFSWFEEHMGQERAATMMNLVPPVGWADVASRHDLEELDARLTTRIDALETKIDARFDAKLNALRSDLLRAFGTWLFASQAAVIAAISVVIALIALG